MGCNAVRTTGATVLTCPDFATLKPSRRRTDPLYLMMHRQFPPVPQETGR
jgi:hypothetical protein